MSKEQAGLQKELERSQQRAMKAEAALLEEGRLVGVMS
jgi:hypothetical protein